MRLSTFKLVPQIDRSERLIAFAQTVYGKLFILVCFGLLLPFARVGHSPVVLIIVALVTFLPRHRRLLLTIAALGYLTFGFTSFYWPLLDRKFPGFLEQTGLNTPVLRLLCGVATLVFCWGFVTLSRKRVDRFYLHRPILTLITGYIGLLSLLSYASPPIYVEAGCWMLAIYIGRYLWFLCFSLTLSAAPSPPSFWSQICIYLPFWSPNTNIPYPKGIKYLEKTESTRELDLAKCQLSGLKLLIWATYLSFFDLLVRLCSFGSVSGPYGFFSARISGDSLTFLLNSQIITSLSNPLPFFAIPSMEKAFRLAQTDFAYPATTNWLVLLLDFYLMILTLSFLTHGLVAVIRMCGFNVLRNVYRPLYSPNIAEFFNRLYYYYKELLVTIFFYPTFLRYFKNNPKLRIYAATMSAAFVGNSIFHFLRDIGPIVDKGIVHAAWAFQSFFLYTFILGNAIFFSQMFTKRYGRYFQHRGTRLLATLWVLLFFAIINIFGESHAPITECLNFFTHLT